LFLQSTRVLATSLSGVSYQVSQHFYNMTGVTTVLSPALSSMYTNTASLLVVLPLLIVYLFAQRYFVESIERTGIVG